jgi:methylated-DNA-[protein]-cysteine S-methyltransferase
MRAEPIYDQDWTVLESPLGALTLRGGAEGLAALEFPGRGPRRDEARRRPDGFAAAREQLEAYFAGESTAFELALDLGGTPFQRAVWDALRRIPYGTTVSYAELARTIGRPDRARAVGAAVGRTPVPIVVPCHRVVGSDGSLTGYGGGLQRKAALLDLEARTAAGRPPEPAWAFRQLALLER